MPGQVPISLGNGLTHRGCNIIISFLYNLEIQEHNALGIIIIVTESAEKVITGNRNYSADLNGLETPQVGVPPLWKSVWTNPIRLGGLILISNSCKNVSIQSQIVKFYTHIPNPII